MICTFGWARTVRKTNQAQLLCGQFKWMTVLQMALPFRRGFQIEIDKMTLLGKLENPY